MSIKNKKSAASYGYKIVRNRLVKDDREQRIIAIVESLKADGLSLTEIRERVKRK